MKYIPQEIPIKTIKKMIKNGSWKYSLEKEEVLYNLANNLYSKQYAKKVKSILESEE